MDKNAKTAGNISFGIPSIVIGVLIALKEIGLTNMAYTSIIWFGIKVWIVCALFFLVMFLILLLIKFIFTSFK